MDYQPVEDQLWSDWLGFMLKLNPELEFRYPQKFWINRRGSTASSWGWGSMGWHVPYDPTLTSPPKINDQLRPLWAHIPMGGDLCLGTGSLKPTLWQCHRQELVDLVRRGAVGYSRALVPELILHFGTRPRDSNEQRQKQVQQWLDQTRLTAEIDTTDPRYQYHGEALLARLISHSHLSVFAQITDQTRVQGFQILLD